MILGWVQTERTCPSSPGDHGSKKEKRRTESLRPVFFLELERIESLKEATTTDVQYLPDFPQEQIPFSPVFKHSHDNAQCIRSVRKLNWLCLLGIFEFCTKRSAYCYTVLECRKSRPYILCRCFAFQFAPHKFAKTRLYMLNKMIIPE